MGAVADLSVDSIVVRRNCVVEAEVDGEIVALDIDRGTYYSLNTVGSHIWKSIVEPSRVGDMCSRLVSQFDVDPATCERDVLALLEELRGENLIEVIAAPARSEM